MEITKLGAHSATLFTFCKYGKVSTSRLTSTSRPFDFQKIITGYNNGDNHILRGARRRLCLSFGWLLDLLAAIFSEQ
jgi:hypothetical protein